MSGLLKTKVDLGFIVNPFYLYCLAFSVSILIYLFGWSNIFPALSVSLILFFAVTFVLFIFAGYYIVQKEVRKITSSSFKSYFVDIIFGLIILLCLINLAYMGYIPILDRSHNYREFGMPVVDPLFSSLSIFFSVSVIHSFLDTRKKKLLIYFLIILSLQVILYRRSTIIWILTSSVFLILIYKQRISLIVILISIILIPLFSFCFGLYGNTRSKLSKSFVLDELGASEHFKNIGISHNHYMTYLYLSSPLANLQDNVNNNRGNLDRNNLREFIFYCFIPESATIRLEKPLNLSPPSCYLISAELLAGTYFMIGFYLLSWYGMGALVIYLFAFIILCLFVIGKWNKFRLETYSLLCTTVSLLIFSNFLNRLDVIFMLFVYPVIFHFIFTRDFKRFTSAEKP